MVCKRPLIPDHLRNPNSCFFYKPGGGPLLERMAARMCCRHGNSVNLNISSSDNTPNQEERKRKISSRDLYKLFAKMIRTPSGRYLFKYNIRRHHQLTKKRKKRQAENRKILSHYVGTPHVPVYVMLPLGVINMECEVVDFLDVYEQFKDLESINVDGVMVVVWWGIVEADNPRQYNWLGYEILFKILSGLNLKLQIVMAFHECGGNDGDDVYIPLPKWIKEIGEENPDIYFTDRDGTRNSETLTWGIDEEHVLGGRTALEVYFEFMRSFRVKFDKYFKKGTITKIEIGLGACGELRYPSYPANHGWEYPGVGEFQCYDKYLRKSLEEAAEESRHSNWGSPPDNAGSYNSKPQDTGFFCDGGDYRTPYGRFFLNWYSQGLIDHADRVLAMAKMAVEDSPIAVKLSGIHWWYKSGSHAAELTAGFYNTADRDGYAPIASMLKKKQVALNFTCAEPRTLEGFPEAMADPGGLVSQVLNAAWDAGIPVTSENALPCHDRQGYNKILEHAKPKNNLDGRHLSAFTYRWLDEDLIEEDNFREFKLFVKRMHGRRR